MNHIMKHINLKMIIGSIIFALTIQTINAQSVAKIGYFMDNAPYKHVLNPALVPSAGYVSIPGIGSINLDFQSNLGVKNFLFPAVNENDPLLTFMHDDVTPEQFLSQLNPNNYLLMNQRISLLSMGLFKGTTFWNFDVAIRANEGFNIPRSFFAFMKEGMSNEQGNRYEINDLSLSFGTLAEASLGSSFLVTDDIRVGVKGKLLFGVARANIAFEEVIIDMRPDKWSVTANGLANTYIKGGEFETDEDGVVSGLKDASAGVTGFGVGLDMGASWITPVENLTVSAGIVDLGVIGWNKTHNSVARSSGTTEFTGIEGIGLDEDNQEEEEEPFAEVIDNFKKLVQLKPTNENNKLSEGLSPTINLGAEYKILEDKITAGLLFSSRLIPKNSISEITGIINFKPISLVNVSASYTLLNNVAQSIGLGLGLNLGIANIFLACDYIPMIYTSGDVRLPLTKATTNFQAGFAILLGKMDENKK